MKAKPRIQQILQPRKQQSIIGQNQFLNPTPNSAQILIPLHDNKAIIYQHDPKFSLSYFLSFYRVELYCFFILFNKSYLPFILKQDFIFVRQLQYHFDLQEQILQQKRHISMAKIGKEKLSVLIDQMSHYDPDNMQMAAKRLSQLIIAGQVNLEGDEKTATIIRQAYMKQIQSQNDTVQSEAIKYLADIVPKLPSEQVEIIFEKILGHIINLNLHQKKRERYGACAATVIHQAAIEHGHKLQNLFLKSISRLLQFKDKKTEVEIILINIITEFIKKWPDVSTGLEFDRKNLILYLLRNIEVKNKLDIIKKSQNCLGKLSFILGRDHINLLLNEQDVGLIKFLRTNKGIMSLDNLKQERNGLLCLTQIIRTHNIQLRFWIKVLALQLVDVINTYRVSQDIEDIEIICDILDAALTALSYILKTFSKELKDSLELRDNPFNSFVCDLLNFNVEGMMSYAGEPMDVEQQYEQDQQYYEEVDVDEKCWKVRRATLNYISVLAKVDAHFLNKIGDGELVEELGNKLVQEHSMVSEMAFTSFNQLIQIISTNKASLTEESIQEGLGLQRVKSSSLSVADKLIKQITKRIKIVFNNSKFNDQLKIQSSKILLKIIQSCNNLILSNRDDTLSLINFIFDELKKTNIIENKLNLFTCLKELISNNNSLEDYERIYAYINQQILKTNNIKIHNICISSLRRYMQVFTNSINQGSKLYNIILPILKNKIKEFDGDKIIKLSVLKCLGSALTHLVIAEDDEVYFLEMLSAKLKIDVEKLPIVETLGKLREGTASAAKAKIIEILIKQLADNIGSNNYELNLKSIDTINKFLSIINKKLSDKSIQELLEKSKNLLVEGKIPSFFKIIVESHPKLLKPYTELIIKSTEPFYVSKLINSGVVDVQTVVGIFKTLDLVEKGKKISLTLGSIGLTSAQIFKEINQSNWGRVMVGALGYVGDDSTLSNLFQLLETFKIDELKYAVCSAIGNIISRNQSKLVPQIMQVANSSKDVYLYIYIFKEMISYNSSPFSHLSQLIQWLLLKSQNKFQAESNYFITSECVGKLAFISPQATDLVIYNAKSSNQNRRLIVANSVRFGLQGNDKAEAAHLEEYIQAIITLFSDPNVKVREGAVKSLIAVAQYYPKGLKNVVAHKDFWSTLVFNSQINNDLITIIDYGICKQEKDEGKNLRLQTFNLLQILLKKFHIENHFFEDLMGASIHRLNNESSNDIVLKRLNVLRILCEHDFTHFVRHQDSFLTFMNFKDGLLKKYQTKAPEDERVQAYLKGVFQELTIMNNLLKQENIDKVGNLLLEYRKNNALALLLDSIQKN